MISIDMPAGPSEVLVIADKHAIPSHIAADLLSQAEHDRLASAVLVTDSDELALAVEAELEKQIPLLSRADIARESIDRNGKIIVADDLTDVIAVANEIAPEHLELGCVNSWVSAEGGCLCSEPVLKLSIHHSSPCPWVW